MFFHLFPLVGPVKAECDKVLAAFGRGVVMSELVIAKLLRIALVAPAGQEVRI